MNNMTILTQDTWHLVQLFQNIERGCWIIKGATAAGAGGEVPDYDITSAVKLSIGSTTGFYNHGEGPYKGLLLVESAYYCFHI